MGDSDSPSDDPAKVVNGFYDWINDGRGKPDARHDPGFDAYFRGVAEARYVIRKVLRIVDEQAKRVGLEPLEHQALIQIFGSASPHRVSDLAERLDIAPAFASRLVRGLEADGLVIRSPSAHDKRSTYVTATESARNLLAEIDEGVDLHVGYFHRQLSDAERAVAFGIFAFYVGASRVDEMQALLALAYGTRRRLTKAPGD